MGKSLTIHKYLQHFVIDLPQKKNISALNFTLYGIDVKFVASQLQIGKELHYNIIDETTTKFIIYGGRTVLVDNKIIVNGYQTRSIIKMRDVTGASPDAERVSIANRYKEDMIHVYPSSDLT